MPKRKRTFHIGIAVYEGVDLLDVSAPYEIFNWMAEQAEGSVKFKVHLLAETKRAVRTRDGLRFSPQKSFAKSPRLDLIWVPGGDPDALARTMQHAPYIDFILSQSECATYVTSVCEGALLLAAAGLLKGRRVTTHWAFINCLKAYEGVTVAEGFPRFVVDEYADDDGRTRYLVTGGGISSGLDEALELVRLILGEPAAEGVQVTTQYFPGPPVNGQIPDPGPCPLSPTDG